MHTLVALPHTLPTGGTTATEAITDFVPGFRGRIEAWSFVTTVAFTGSGATRTPNLEINSTNVTGSDGVALALADGSVVGEVKALGTITALNDFDADDTISIEWAASGTTFDAGAGYFLLRLRQELQDS